jgi:hypothetical protein
MLPSRDGRHGEARETHLRRRSEEFPYVVTCRFLQRKEMKPEARVWLGKRAFAQQCVQDRKIFDSPAVSSF